MYFPYAPRLVPHFICEGVYDIACKIWVVSVKIMMNIR